MKLLSHVLLLVVMLASRKCQESDEWTDDIFVNISYEWSSVDVTDFQGRGDHIIRVYEISSIPEPNITVYQQIKDRENVIVMCKLAETFGIKYRRQPFDLFVESELNYTMEILKCSSDSLEICVFLVTVSPPASFTCVHEFYFDLDVRNLRSQTYNYSGSVSDHHEEGVSVFYICFSSFITVGLLIMTAAVIVTNIRSKAKDTISSTTVTNSDHVGA